MTRKSWRKILHKFVIFSGFMALTAMAAGEAGKVDRAPDSITESLIKPRVEVKIPLIVNQRSGATMNDKN